MPKKNTCKEIFKLKVGKKVFEIDQELVDKYEDSYFSAIFKNKHHENHDENGIMVL